MSGQWHRYVIVDSDGGEYSADPADYWSAPDSARLGDGLVRTNHEYRTVTGVTVTGPRLVKSEPTVGDLRRIAARAGEQR